MTLERGKDFMHNAEMGMGPCGLVPTVPAGAMGRTLRIGPERLDIFPVREHTDGRSRQVCRVGLYTIQGKASARHSGAFCIHGLRPRR